MIDPWLENKVVLITGANHGIGAATASVFSAQGAKVFITYYRDECPYSDEELQAAKKTGVGGPELYYANHQQTANDLVEEIMRQGGVAAALEVDLGIEENISMLFERCEAELGPVDVLVNNHTYCVLETFDPGLVTEDGLGIDFISAEEIDAHFRINTRAYALMMGEYVKRYLQRKGEKGSIINVSTDAAHAYAANVSYAASKHAIESYSRSAANELGKYGIRINVVSPGPVQTGYITPEGERGIVEGTPLGAVGEPEHIADAIVFLASEQARWITGQMLYVGGGWRMGQ